MDNLQRKIKDHLQRYCSKETKVDVGVVAENIAFLIRHRFHPFTETDQISLPTIETHGRVLFIVESVRFAVIVHRGATHNVVLSLQGAQDGFLEVLERDVNGLVVGCLQRCRKLG